MDFQERTTAGRLTSFKCRWKDSNHDMRFRVDVGVEALRLSQQSGAFSLFKEMSEVIKGELVR